MRFDFTDLNLFRHIVEAGSITHGAARSNLALAAASTRIRKMELAFGTELLLRGRQGVVPTPAGRTLLQHARGILAQTDRLREDLTPYARGLAGQVRVLSNTNALTEFLPETLSSFLMAYPDISVDLEERLSDEIVGLMAEGAADIGIVAGTVDFGSLHTFPFRSDRFVLVVARSHPLASRARIGFAEVLDYDMVGLDRASAIQRFLADKRRRHRAGDDSEADRAQHGDRIGSPDRRLGVTRIVDLRARCRHAAGLCAPAGRSLARECIAACGVEPLAAICGERNRLRYDFFAARCATTTATPPSVAAEAINKRNVICSESMTTPPKAAITGTVS